MTIARSKKPKACLSGQNKSLVEKAPPIARRRLPDLAVPLS
jgi:hypothetical protein